MVFVTQPGHNFNRTDWFQLVTRDSKGFISKLSTQSKDDLNDLFTKQDSLGYKLLHYACKSGDIDVVLAMMRLGCPIDSITGIDGTTAVHVATENGHLVLLNLLCRFGANLFQADINGRVALHYAVINNQVCVLAWLLHHTQLCDLTTQDAGGYTSIHLACMYGNRFTLEYIINYLCNTTVAVKQYFMQADHRGNNCLHMMFMNNKSRQSMNIMKKNLRILVKQVRDYRRNELVWPLLTIPVNSPSFMQPCLALVIEKNGENQKPIDYAKKVNAGVAICMLLYISEKCVHRFGAEKGQSYVSWIYNIIWFFFAALPFIVCLLSILLAHMFSSSLLYVIGFLVMFGLLSSQRHRLQDGTYRPNPLFHTIPLTSLTITLYCFIFDVWSSLANVTWSDMIEIFVIGVNTLSLLSVFIYITYKKPINQMLEPYVSNKSLQDWVTGETDRLLFSEPQVLSKPAASIQEIYCPHCDIIKLKPQYVKHCKLCKTCSVGVHHHCLFVMNCVNRTNQHHFVILVFLICSFNTLFLRVSFRFLSSVCADGSLSTNPTFSYVAHCIYDLYPRLLIVCLINLISLLWNFALLIEQLRIIYSRKLRGTILPSVVYILRNAKENLNSLIYGQHDAKYLTSSSKRIRIF